MATKDARPKCPGCGERVFGVQPFATPTLVYDYTKNGHPRIGVDDSSTDERDDVVCANCGWEGHWSDTEKHFKGG